MSSDLIVSVGYERRSLEDLVAVLLDYGVKKLLDVREAPISRRRGFNKRSLEARLDEAGIAYRHLRIAGNPHRRLKMDIEQCLHLYRGHLCDNPEVVATVAGELVGQAVAFLCYEREHDNCHRSVLLHALAEKGHDFEVVRVE